MTVRNGLFSSESVSEGHPDKLADQISDRILDAFLALDPHARVACETMLADQCVIVAGEFKTRKLGDFDAVRESADSLVRQVLRDDGYTNACNGKLLNVPPRLQHCTRTQNSTLTINT